MTIEEVKDKLELRLIDLIKYLYIYKKVESEAKDLQLNFVIKLEDKNYNCKCSVELEEYEDNEKLV